MLVSTACQPGHVRPLSWCSAGLF